MPIYEYETMPSEKNRKVKRYEIRQSLQDEPLSVHPDTGEPIKKVFAAFAVGSSGAASAAASKSSGHCCGGGCGCHH